MKREDHFEMRMETLSMSPIVHRTAPDAALLQAYRETRYWVHPQPAAGEPFAMLIGLRSQELSELHRAWGVECSTFITACNPFSQRLAEAQNAVRMESLMEVLQARSLRWLTGHGIHPENGWPAEPSLLVPGLSLAAAKVLAKAFEQNAFVWAASDAIPQLVCLP
jgi:hypothetical protein